MAEIVDYAIFALIPLAMLVGYYIFRGRRKDEERATLEARWIYPSIRLVTAYESLVGTKELLRKYSDELGWTIKEGKADGTRVALYIVPATSQISPKEYLANQKKYNRISYAILRDIICAGDEGKARNNLHPSKSVEVVGVKSGGAPGRLNFYFRQESGLLTIEYPLANRLMMERQNAATASLAFGGSLVADLRSIFGKENLEASERNIRSNAEKMISEIGMKRNRMQDKTEIEKAAKAMREIRGKEEALVDEIKQGNEKLRRQIEEAFGIEVN